MTQAEYEEVLDACGGTWEPLSRSERDTWQQRWREAYAAGLYAATGKWKLGQFEWHVFSFQHARALNALRAVNAYQAEAPQPVIVCPESLALPAVLLRGTRLPDFSHRGADLLVAPPDLSWTMAFTHEESLDIGPYFSRREWLEYEGA